MVSRLAVCCIVTLSGQSFAGDLPARLVEEASKLAIEKKEYDGFKCNAFVSVVLRLSVEDFPRGDLSVPGLVTWLKKSPGFEWYPRSAAPVPKVGDVLFMVKDPLIDKKSVACQKAPEKLLEIPDTLDAGAGHHVGVVVDVRPDGSIELAESGDKERNCIKLKKNVGIPKGTHVMVYEAHFLTNTLYGLARPKP